MKLGAKQNVLIAVEDEPFRAGRLAKVAGSSWTIG
jgi:hypothetical protein